MMKSADDTLHSSVCTQGATCEVAVSARRLHINPQDWAYLAEGGFHIILRYLGPDPNLQGKILRIGKKSLVHGAPGELGSDVAEVSTSTNAARGSENLYVPTTSTEPPPLPVSETPTSTSDTGSSSVEGVGSSNLTVAMGTSKPVRDEAGVRSMFENVVLKPLLGAQYVQPGDAVKLSREDMHTIHDCIDHERPAGRVGNDAGHWSPEAQVEPDKTSFWLKTPRMESDVLKSSEDKRVVIAVEIKPKGAEMPIGALVEPGPNRLQYRVRRFDAQQRFKSQIQQSWGTIKHVTGYHPRELFSGDAGRAGATLKDLLKTPQNKLRIWENGNMLSGAGSGGDGPEADAAGAKLIDLAVERAALEFGEGKPGDALMDLIGDILSKEPLAKNMMEVQKLDVAGVEGAGLIFQRLVSLCGDSKDKALDLLEMRETASFQAKEVPRELVLPEQLLHSLRTEPASMASLTEKHGAELDYHRQEALGVVARLDLEDCVQLLRRFVIALGVMDCSIMISLKAVTGKETKESPLGTVDPHTPQGNDTAGVLRTADGRHVAYCLSVVDAGPKPPSKIANKADREHLIWEFIAGLGDELKSIDTAD